MSEEKIDTPEDNRTINPDSGNGVEDSSTDKAIEEIEDENKSFTPPVDNSQPDLDSVRHTAQAPKNKNRFTRFIKNKKISIPLIIVVIIGLLFAVPYTRYLILGSFIKEKFTLRVIDSQTNVPISDASVTVSGKTGITDNHGNLSLELKPGNTTITINKNYYAPFAKKILVRIGKQTTQTYQILATGRQVPIKVVDRISQLPINDAQVSAAGSQVNTDNNGKAVIVLPADQTTVGGTVTVAGYNTEKVNLTISSQVLTSNSFQLIPNGSIYFLSNQSGKIDVVKTNLDGSNRTTVLAGTGNEDPFNTVLLTSPSTKYVALLAKRTSSGNGSVYMIDTSNDSLYTVDSGDASFIINGWSGDNLVYTVNRLSVQPWQNNAQALKSFNAPAKQINTLDQTQAQGTNNDDYQGTMISNVNVLNNEIVYSQTWSSPAPMTGKSDSLLSIKPDGTGKKTIKSFSVPDNTAYGFYVYAITGKPGQVYVQTPGSTAGSSQYFTYANGSVQETPTVSNAFNAPSTPTYYLSPLADKYYWSANRDGQAELTLSDSSGNSAKTIATIDSTYSAAGWYGENYLLVTKDNKELDIMPVGGISDASQLIKISNYYASSGLQ
jgi:hypothetical protein